MLNTASDALFAISASSYSASLKADALQNAILASANFSIIATDEKGIIQLFNVGAERMLGYKAAEVVGRIRPSDIQNPHEVMARAKALSLELATTIGPGFEALAFKASRGIEDIYEMTYIRKDGSVFPAIISITALRDNSGNVIGYLLIGTDNHREWCVAEAMVLAGFEFTPLELIEQGDAAIAQIIVDARQPRSLKVQAKLQQPSVR